MNKNKRISHCFTAIVCTLFYFSASCVAANEPKSYLQLWRSIDTYHVDRANDEASFEQNQVTSIFYGRWFAGTFVNSYQRRSELVGYHFWYNISENEDWFWHYGASVAAATGYGRELATNIDGLVTLGVSPFAGVKWKFNHNWALGLDVIYIPTDNDGVFVSGLNISFRLD